MIHSIAYYFGVNFDIFQLKKAMDEKLQQIFKIRPLQIDCIAYRSSKNEYLKMVKGACVSELKNLLNVEMKVDQVNLKIPDDDKVPNITEEIKTSKADYLLNEFSLVEEGLHLL